MSIVPSSWPALCRPSTSFRDLHSKVVDGRAKPGHDGGCGRWIEYVNIFGVWYKRLPARGPHPRHAITFSPLSEFTQAPAVVAAAVAVASICSAVLMAPGSAWPLAAESWAIAPLRAASAVFAAV